MSILSDLKSSGHLKWVILLVVLLLLIIIAIILGVTLGSKDQSYSDPVRRFQGDVDRLVQHLVKGDGQGQGWKWLADLSERYGSRQIGSKGFDKALADTQASLKKQGFANVHTEDVLGLPRWQRDKDSAFLLSPRRQRLGLLAISGTVNGTVNADAVVVRSLEELKKMGKNGVNGKIVVFNQAWTNYSNAVAYRYAAGDTAKLGAVGLLTKSVTSFSVYSPHTGWGGDNITIPSACITVEDAEMLWRMQERKQAIKIELNINSHMLGWDLTSQNQIFEILGSEKPEEIVLLSGHFDSWDVGNGAMDDGGGIASAWQAATAIKDLGLPLKRTLRIIFFTAEEEGYFGSKYYYNQHKGNKSETYYFVSECDSGAFKPTSAENATALVQTEDAGWWRNLASATQLINDVGVPLSMRNTSGIRSLGDAKWWGNDGVPGFTYMEMAKQDYYFIFHHTEGDTMSVLKEEDIDYTAAIYGAFAFIAANL